jgi:hypothetical protein
MQAIDKLFRVVPALYKFFFISFLTLWERLLAMGCQSAAQVGVLLTAV